MSSEARGRGISLDHPARLGGASTRSNGDGLSSALAWMYKHARLCNGCSYHTHVEAMKQGDAQKHTDRMWSCCRDHILS